MPLPDELSRLHVVLVAPRNPLNIGAAARAMSNFGFQSLRLVNPYAPSFREARSAVGASDILANAKRYKSVADAVNDCTLVSRNHCSADARPAALGQTPGIWRPPDPPANKSRQRGFALRLGKIRPFERFPKPLPLADPDPHMRSEYLHESGTGGCRLPV